MSLSKVAKSLTMNASIASTPSTPSEKVLRLPLGKFYQRAKIQAHTMASTLITRQETSK